MLVIAHLVEADGVFRWLGTVLADRSRGAPQRLLTLVFGAAAVTTAVLSLDATVVLLTPVILTTVRRLGVRGAPPVYATAHLSNSASLLLPVSNLTNLLAFHASGLTFVGFAGLMAGPWLVCIAVEYVAFRWFFRSELAETPQPRSTAVAPPFTIPWTSLIVLGVILLGLAVAPAFDLEPWVVAAAGAAGAAVRALRLRQVTVRSDAAGDQPAVPDLRRRARRGGRRRDRPRPAGRHWPRVLPTGASLPSLLALAVIAAVLANLINNLPATLVLLAALGTVAGRRRGAGRC